jgi:GNAT superfamily N-acetyltransferase
MNQLTQDTGVNLWDALTISHQHLEEYKLSERINKSYHQDNINIIDYTPIYQESFKALNVEWISQFWELEDPDLNALDSPDDYILNKGGVIMIALYDDVSVGCCALIKIDECTYELAKMAVSPKVQGKGIGILLGKKIIEKAKKIGAKRLFLESNTRLEPAINLYLKLGFVHIKGETSPYNRCNVQMELCLEE